jgi:hypothetical protein
MQNYYFFSSFYKKKKLFCGKLKVYLGKIKMASSQTRSKPAVIPDYVKFLFGGLSG